MNLLLLFYIQIGFILHFVGDYLLQSSWMATEKIKSNQAACIHALIYSLPFLLITNPIGWSIIFITHFFIDRYRLATYWIRLINNDWKSKNYGYPDITPIWLSTWLMIIVDNTFHIIINTIVIILTNWK